MPRFDRICLLVLDACGVGELPDAALYHDAGSNTLGNIARSIGGLNLPNLGRLGLGNIIDIPGTPAAVRPDAYHGKMAEKSAGKDSTIGHWEIAGIISKSPFPVYPDGFPVEIIDAFENAIGRKTLGNVAASGTEIIARLGDEHRRTGRPIVYTSADSVFQIAAHVEVIPLDQLYEYCRVARKMLTGKHNVSRVIARPFAGSSGDYRRTADRKDFSLEPPQKTMLDLLHESGLDVLTIGKVDDLFAGRGVTRAVHTKSNSEGIEAIIEYFPDRIERGLVFANLVDFDMLWGHRNDVQGFAAGLRQFDSRLPEILDRFGDDDLLIICADHGCDPTTASTDHSREYVPLIVYSSDLGNSGDLGTRETFADVAATILENFALPRAENGESFLGILR